jgi:hypothetical protein
VSIQGYNCLPRRGQILAPGDYVFQAGAFNNPTKTITVFAGIPWPVEERLPALNHWGRAKLTGRNKRQ